MPFSADELYSQAPNFVWAKGAGGAGQDAGFEIATDQSGISVITGSFYETATFGDIALTSAGLEDAFIAQYDALGNVLWVDQISGQRQDQGLEITIDQSHNIMEHRFKEVMTFASFRRPHRSEA
jgi:hypothetical protein